MKYASGVAFSYSIKLSVLAVVGWATAKWQPNKKRALSAKDIRWADASGFGPTYVLRRPYKS